MKEGWEIKKLEEICEFQKGFAFKSNLFKKEGIPIGYGVKMAIGLLLATSILTLISDRFRKVILKEGRDFNDIKKFVYFIILVCGIMFLGFITFNFKR